jgi:hypothetical protein
VGLRASSSAAIWSGARLPPYGFDMMPPIAARPSSIGRSKTAARIQNTLCASTLVLFPVVFGCRTIFSKSPGKLRTIVYFACLGIGYIMVEVGLTAHFILALSNATVSASILITGMLVASGLGSPGERSFFRPGTRHIATNSAGDWPSYGLFIHYPLEWIGTFPYGLRLFFCFLMVFPAAFLMGFPMPTGMGSLARLKKDHMFLWAWGINGCFSVIGAALVPLVATSFGLSAVLLCPGCNSRSPCGRAYELIAFGF